MNTKNLCIIELSEFSVELLTQAVSLYKLENIAKILQFKKSSYKTNDRYNSGYLTPEAQWVSVHTGMPARTPLGLRKDQPPQKSCWQILNEHSISIYEAIYPNTKIALLKTGFKLGCFFQILKKIIQVKRPKVNTQYITRLDFIHTLLFCKAKQKYKPQCSVLSLKSLAHCQYYYWTGDDKTLSAELEDALKSLDKILGLIFTQFPDDSFVIHNALSQMKAEYEQTDSISGKNIKYTGRLIPMGTIYSQEIHFPNHIFNHEFNRYIYHYFMPEKFTLKSEYIEDEAPRRCEASTS